MSNYTRQQKHDTIQFLCEEFRKYNRIDTGSSGSTLREGCATPMEPACWRGLR